MSSKSRWLSLTVPLALFLFVGCQSGPSGSVSHGVADSDPLKGGGPPLPPASSVGRGDRGSGGIQTIPSSGNVARSSGPLPLSTPTSSTSPAALTSGAGGVIDQGATLRIGGDGRDTGGRGPSATLQPPASGGPGGVESTPAVPLPLTQVAHLTSTVTVEQLVKTLQDRGGLEPQVLFKNGEWLCTCRVADPGNANLLHAYEATAATSVAAVQAVLDQMDQDRR